MLWIRDHSRADPEDELGVDLEVGVFFRNLLAVDCNVDVLFFFCVDELDVAVLDEGFELDFLVCKCLDRLVCNERLAVFDDEQWDVRARRRR